ncbi:MAG: SRPBCC family protein, partial [Paracoccaceae bacterium]|nr:SRPBCC family protein [Paracoccaceae bacterium]
SRTDTLRVAGPGMAWLVQFPYRGKDRKVAIRLTDQKADQCLGFAGSSAMVDGSVTLDLLEMGAKRTRVTVVTEIKPRTLTARLFLQTLRLARARMTKRYQTRIAQLGADIEDRYRSKIRLL